MRVFVRFDTVLSLFSLILLTSFQVFAKGPSTEVGNLFVKHVSGDVLNVDLRVPKWTLKDVEMDNRVLRAENGKAEQDLAESLMTSLFIKGTCGEETSFCRWSNVISYISANMVRVSGDCKLIKQSVPLCAELTVFQYIPHDFTVDGRYKQGNKWQTFSATTYNRLVQIAVHESGEKENPAVENKTQLSQKKETSNESSLANGFKNKNLQTFLLSATGVLIILICALYAFYLYISRNSEGENRDN